MNVRRLVAALAALAFVMVVGTAFAATGGIETVAGTGTAGAAGSNGPAKDAQLSFPTATARFGDGGYLIADQGNQRVRRVSPDGFITSLAGNGTAGFSGDFGPAVSATMNAPSGVATLPDGGFLIADANNNRVRKVTAGGTIGTVAGGGASLGNGGQATNAQLRFPFDVAASSDGSFLIADVDNHMIRRVAANGVISTVAGTGAQGAAGDGGQATSAALNKPSGLALTGPRGFLVADTENNRVRFVTEDGVISNYAGTGQPGYSGDGGSALSAKLDAPVRVAIDGDGAVLIAERDNSVIRRVSRGGIISTVAGDGTAGFSGDAGPATTARLDKPFGLMLTGDNDLLVADTFNQRIRRVDYGDPTDPPPPPPPPPPTPPPPPAPPPVTRNEVPPSISEAFLTATRPNYLCDAGRWLNLKSGTGFTYEWYRVDLKRGERFFLRTENVKVADGVTYLLPEADKGKTFFCAVTVTATDGRRLTLSSESRALSGRPRLTLASAISYGNVQVRGIDLFQTTQPSVTSESFLFAADFLRTSECGGGTPTSFAPGAGAGTCDTPRLLGGNPQQAQYKGVDIDADRNATAIVYVNTTEGPPGRPAAELLLRLRARIGGKLEPLELTQRIRDVAQREAAFVTPAERARAQSAYRFVVPGTWLDRASRGGLSLEATVAVPPENPDLVECQRRIFITTTCSSADNTFTLTSVPVSDNLASLAIRSLPMNGAGEDKSPLKPPQDVLKAVVDTFPGGNRMVIQPYSGVVDISKEEVLVLRDAACKDFTSVRSCRITNVQLAGDTWLAADQANRTGYDVLLAVHDYPTGAGATEPGWVPGGGNLETTSGVPRMFLNDGSASRPWTAAAHEFGHVMGAPHADRASPDPVGGAGSCGGNANGQVAEAWPPNDFGRLDGFAFGFYSGLPTSSRGTDVTEDDPSATVSGNALWDMMSYCAPESRAWLSPRNWRRTFQTLQRYFRTGRPSRLRTATATATASAAGRPRGRAAASAGQAFVVGTFGPKGVSIERVVPADPGNGPPAPVPDSQLQITAFGGAGQTLARVGAVATQTLDSPEPSGTFIAPLPSGVAAVQATTPSGQVLDRLERTKPPTIDLTSPKAGDRVRGGQRSRLTVRWRSSDPERQPLQARVEYASDGRAYRTVWQGADAGRAVVPGKDLPAGRGARVRVIVSDGFNAAEDVSGTFAADGAPPVAAITAPAMRERVSGGAGAILRGQATDDRGEVLRGSALTWFAGRTRLGTGAELRKTLPVGRVRLRLVARDRLGRTTTATRSVTVEAPPLELARFDAPERVTARATSVSVRVTTSAPATLVVGRRRIAVGPTARRVTLRLPSSPKLGTLRIPYRIASRGASRGTVRGALQVARL